MVGFAESQVCKIAEECGIGKTIEEIKKRNAHAIESYLVELLRHPSLANVKPEDIRLVITQGYEGYSVKFTYGIEIAKRVR